MFNDNCRNNGKKDINDSVIYYDSSDSDNDDNNFDDENLKIGKNKLVINVMTIYKKLMNVISIVIVIQKMLMIKLVIMILMLLENEKCENDKTVNETFVNKIPFCLSL